MRHKKNNFPPKIDENKPLCRDKDKKKEELHPSMKIKHKKRETHFFVVYNGISRQQNTRKKRGFTHGNYTTNINAIVG